MNTNQWLLAALGAALVGGCAGPLDHRWDDPVYRSLQDRYGELDRDIAHAPDQEHSLPAFGLESLDVLSVEDAVRIAIGNSPRLRAAGYQIDAASGRVLQAGLYPNPSLNFEGEALGSDDGEWGETAYVIEQEIVLGGKLDRARDVAESDRSAARARFIAEEFAIASSVTRAYFAGVSAQQRLVMREELAGLALQLLDAATARVEAGSATKPDQLRAEVVYEQAMIELDAARLDANATMRALGLVIGSDGSIKLDLVSSADRLPILASLESLQSAAIKANSRVSLARIAIERARRSHQLAKSQSMPNLVASIGPRYSDIDHESTVDVGLGIEIPIFDRNQGEIRATLAERLSASADLKNVQVELLAEVSHAWSAYQSAHSASIRYQNQLLPKAELTLDLTRQAYKSGKADYLRLLDAQQVVIESRIAYINTLEHLHNASVLLNELTQTHAPWRNARQDDHPQAEANQ